MLTVKVFQDTQRAREVLGNNLAEKLDGVAKRRCQLTAEKLKVSQAESQCNTVERTVLDDMRRIFSTRSTPVDDQHCAYIYYRHVILQSWSSVYQHESDSDDSDDGQGEESGTDEFKDPEAIRKAFATPRLHT
ncbi:hypothetical protein NM688_g1738 [Phlebia brevispora]|uniref:Uncharacterized protein n=1 Tax=Phlebia brevispora TaxID=194682 RepID=A0ACC1TAL1_9APHY|nr:hypothetical protein NM688_g1738 [Phlebia brevispora]